MSFTKLPAIDPIRHCLNCPPRPQTADMEMLLHPGFGDASVTCNDEHAIAVGEDTTVADAENAAQAAPEADWRIHIYAPLYEATYQRQGDGQWVLVERGEGFA